MWYRVTRSELAVTFIALCPSQRATLRPRVPQHLAVYYCPGDRPRLQHMRLVPFCSSYYNNECKFFRRSDSRALRCVCQCSNIQVKRPTWVAESGKTSNLPSGSETQGKLLPQNDRKSCETALCNSEGGGRLISGGHYFRYNIPEGS